MTEKQMELVRHLWEMADMIHENINGIWVSLDEQKRELPEYSSQYKKLDEECELLLEAADYAQKIKDILNVL